MKPSLSIMFGHDSGPKSHQSDLMAALGSHGSSEDGEEPSEKEQYEAAMSDFIDAIHSKDVKGAAEAFRDVLALCPEEKHEDDEDYIAGDHGSAGILDDPS